MPNTMRRTVCISLTMILLLCFALPAGASGFAFRTKAPHEDDEAYQAGLKYYAEGKYFSAYESFMNSDAGEDAEAQMQKCIQKWPKNGEVWRSKDAKAKNVELTFRIDQAEDRAYFVRLYKDGQPVSYLFIGGPGKVTVKLPNGRYTIKDGSGKQWFGIKEAFGRYGSYETMSFDDAGTTVVNLQYNHSYTITINVADADPDADPIGSEYEDWEGFAE